MSVFHEFMYIPDFHRQAPFNFAQDAKLHNYAIAFFRVMEAPSGDSPGVQLPISPTHQVSLQTRCHERLVLLQETSSCSAFLRIVACSGTGGSAQLIAKEHNKMSHVIFIQNDQQQSKYFTGYYWKTK